MTPPNDTKYRIIKLQSGECTVYIKYKSVGYDLILNCCSILYYVLIVYFKAGLLSFVYMPEGWLEVSTRNVLRPANSTQVFLGFPVYYSKCWDGS